MTKQALDQLLVKTARARRAADRLSRLQKCAQQVPGAPGAGPYSREAAALHQRDAASQRVRAMSYNDRLALVRKQLAQVNAAKGKVVAGGYMKALQPLNPTVANITAKTAPKAQPGAKPAGTQAAKPAVQPAAAKPAVPDANAKLQQMGKDFLQAGKNLFTNPVDTIRRGLAGQPLKR